MTKTLEKYFTTAKSSPLLLKEDEVLEIIKHSNTTKHKRKLRYIYFLLPAVATVFVLTIKLCLTNQSSDIPNVSDVSTTPNKSYHPTHERPLSIATSDEINLLSFDKQGRNDSLLPDISIPAGVNTPWVPSFSHYSAWVPNSEEIIPEDNDASNDYMNDNGELMLSHQTLINLGIITDGNHLNYRVITGNDLSIGKRKSTDANGSIPAFKLKVNNSIGRVTYNGTIPTIDSTFFQSFFALAISDSSVTANKVSNELLFTEISFSKGFELDYFNQLKSMLIPVKVILTPKDNNSQTERRILTFYFKYEPSFISALPNHLSTALSKRYGNVLPKSFFSEIRNKYTPFGITIKSFDSLTVANLKQLYITANSEILEQLHINKQSNSIRLVFWNYYQKHPDTKPKLKRNKLKSKGESFYYNYNIPFVLFGLNADKKVAKSPIAVSNFNLTDINFIRNINDSIGPFMHQPSYPYFKSLTPNLYPLFVDSNHVFWYEKNKDTNYILGGAVGNKK